MMDINDPAYQASLAMTMSDAPQPVTEGDAMNKQVSTEEIIDGEIRSMILTRKEASRTFRQQKKEIWDKCWNHYKQVYDRTNKESWQSTTFIPASPKVAEVIISNMHSALMGPDRPVEYQARRPEFRKPVNDANDLIAVDLDKSQFKVHWTDFLRSIGIIGTGIGKIEYQKEYAKVLIKERFKEIPGMGMMRKLLGLPPAPQETMREETRIVKDYASFKYVDRYDIYQEPGSTEISKDRWVIEQGKICNYKLQELANQPDPSMRLVNVTDDVLMNNPKDLERDGDKQEKEAANEELNKTTPYLDPDQEHVLDEYWGPAPVWMVDPSAYGDENRKYEMVYAWFWLIDGQYVVRKQLNPWRDAEPPYVKSVYIRVPGQFDGIGPLELMLGLQVELNESRNCRQDEINLKLSPPLAVVKDMIPPGEFGRLKSGPGALWLTTNTDDVKKALYKVDLNADLGDSWRGSAEIYNEIQEVTAAVKAVVGNDGGSGQNEAGTFRGQMLNKQVASERFIMYARIMEITGLAAAYKKIYQRIYQFKGWKEAEQVLGPKRASEFQFISPEDLEVMARIVPMGVTSMENKGVQLAQMAEEFKLFSAFPWYKQIDAARRMVVARGQSDPDAVILSEDELNQYNQKKQHLIGSMPGMEGPMGPPTGNPGETPPGPIAGNVPGPTDGLPMPAMPARGPGASPIDVTGRPAA